MKKTLFFTFFLFLTTSLFAQKWVWGNEATSKTVGTFAECVGDHSVGVDPMGNAFFGGYLVGTLVFDGHNISCGTNHDEPFLVKFDANTHKADWAAIAVPYNNSINSNGQVKGVAADANGNVYITGFFYDTISFGSFTVRCSNEALFLVKYDPNGNVLWAKQSTGSGLGLSYAMAVDEQNNIYISGTVVDTVKFGSITLTGGYDGDAFVVKYDGNGNPIWGGQSHHHPNAHNSGAVGVSIAIDAAYNSYITGDFTDTVWFGSDTLKEYGFDDALVAKFDANGNPVWAKQGILTGSSPSQRATSISVDAYDHIFATGAFYDTVKWGSYTLTGSVNYTTYVTRFDASGNIIWAKQTYPLDFNGWEPFALASDTLKNDGGAYFLFNNSTSNTPFKVKFANDTFSNNGAYQTASVLLKFDSAGKVTCSTVFSEGDEDDGSALCAAHSGNNIYVGGDLENQMVFGPDTLKIGGEDPFVIDWQPCGKCSVLPSISGIGSICLGQSTTLTASGGTSYLWSNGATTDTITIVPSQTTNYKVTVSNGTCNVKDSITVTVNPLAGTSACCDSSIIPGQSVQLTASGGSVYIWNPPTGLSCSICPDPLATPSHTTTYTLTTTSDSGCTSQQTITIDVSCGTVFVPNAFSPNKDGQNDVLYVRGYCITSMDFAIYDRWGNKVFHTTNPNEGWDGLYAGKPENAGTFVYYLKANMLDGTVVDKKGDISLVR